MSAISIRQTASRFPLAPYKIRSFLHPQFAFSRGRKYAIGASKSTEMLADALNQSTLHGKIQSLKRAVRTGANINQKINNESLLNIISCDRRFEKDFAPLTETIFSLGAKVDYQEYQEGSPLHDALFFVGSTSKKVHAISIYTKYGVHVNHLNSHLATPLDYAYYFDSNASGIDQIVRALGIRGAVHGFGDYSPDRLLPIISMPFSATVILMTSSIALLRKITPRIQRLE